MNDRPTGVTILAVLHLLGGVLGFGAQVWLLFNFTRLTALIDHAGIAPALIVLGFTFLFVLALVSGVGMWLGTRWGWWTASFYYVYSVTRNVESFFNVIENADMLQGSRGPGYYYFKFGGRAVIRALLLYYLFRPRVMEYFEVMQVRRGQAFGILVSIAMLLGAAGTCVMMIMQPK